MEPNIDAINVEDRVVVDAAEPTSNNESPTKPSRLKPLWSAGTILFSLTSIVTAILLEFVWDFNWQERSGWSFVNEEITSMALMFVAIFTLPFRGWISFIISGLICWYFVSQYIIPWLSK